MNLKTEIITNAFIAIFAILIFGKFGGLILQNFFSIISRKNQKKNSMDIDVIIRSKQQILRNGLDSKGDAIKTLRVTEKEIKQKSKTKTIYSAQKHKFNEIVELIDSLQWGEGTSILAIKKASRKIIEKQPSSAIITNIIRIIIQNDTLLKLKTLPTWQEVLKLASNSVALKTIFQEASENGGHYIRKLSADKDVSQSIFIKAINKFHISKNSSRSENSIYKDILADNSPIRDLASDELLKLIETELFSTDKTSFLSIDTMLLKIGREAEIINNISPLPALLGKNDLKTAYKILQVNADSSKEEIKKKYKKLAKAKHPDRIHAHKLPKEYMRISSENFAKLQQAYEILSK